MPDWMPQNAFQWFCVFAMVVQSAALVLVVSLAVYGLFFYKPEQEHDSEPYQLENEPGYDDWTPE